MSTAHTQEKKILSLHLNGINYSSIHLHMVGSADDPFEIFIEVEHTHMTQICLSVRCASTIVFMWVFKESNKCSTNQN